MDDVNRWEEEYEAFREYWDELETNANEAYEEC